VRSERLLMEQLDYNLLFRWYVGLNMDDAIWDVTVFTKNRERSLLSDEHCESGRSSNESTFVAETNIHFSQLRNLDKPGVLIFPNRNIAPHILSRWR
jgi:hypothetical protein